MSSVLPLERDVLITFEIGAPQIPPRIDERSSLHGLHNRPVEELGSCAGHDRRELPVRALLLQDRPIEDANAWSPTPGAPRGLPPPSSRGTSRRGVGVVGGVRIGSAQ